MSAILLRKRLPSTALRSLSRLASSEATPKHVPTPVKEAVPPATTPVVGQAPNRAVKWSTNQQSRPQASSLPRFEQTDMSLQPQPLSAMEMIAKEPVRLVHGRKAVCDGVRDAQGLRFRINQDLDLAGKLLRPSVRTSASSPLEVSIQLSSTDIA
ncbi:hypothetical protein FS837_009094 [Tulasnella sp. UAMH 9824]|nr:hypothetical protein FS837_009094 [Tulasnella sp. UAMH 9824]